MLRQAYTTPTHTFHRCVCLFALDAFLWANKHADTLPKPSPKKPPLWQRGRHEKEQHQLLQCLNSLHGKARLAIFRFKSNTAAKDLFLIHTAQRPARSAFPTCEKAEFLQK